MLPPLLSDANFSLKVTLPLKHFLQGVAYCLCQRGSWEVRSSSPVSPAPVSSPSLSQHYRPGDLSGNNTKWMCTWSGRQTTCELNVSTTLTTVGGNISHQSLHPNPANKDWMTGTHFVFRDITASYFPWLHTTVYSTNILWNFSCLHFNVFPVYQQNTTHFKHFVLYIGDKTCGVHHSHPLLKISEKVDMSAGISHGTLFSLLFPPPLLPPTSLLLLHTIFLSRPLPHSSKPCLLFLQYVHIHRWKRAPLIIGQSLRLYAVQTVDRGRNLRLWRHGTPSLPPQLELGPHLSGLWRCCPCSERANCRSKYDTQRECKRHSHYIMFVSHLFFGRMFIF